MEFFGDSRMARQPPFWWILGYITMTPFKSHDHSHGDFETGATKPPPRVAVRSKKILSVATDDRTAEIEAAQNTDFPKFMPTEGGLNSPDSILSGFNFISAAELARKSFDPQLFLVDGIVPIPNLVLLAGAPKAGKSWYAMSLADQISQKGYRVLYIGNEDNERRLKDRFAAVCSLPNDRVMFFGGLSNDKALPKGDDALAFIRAIKMKYSDLQCIIVDTMQGIRKATDKQDYATIEQEFSLLRKLAHELCITILAVHHTKKRNDFETNPIEMILGSQGIAATVETILILQQEEGSKDAKLFITGKDVEQVADKKLSWCYPGFSRPENTIVAELGSFQQAVLKYIQERPCCMQVAISKYFDKSAPQVSEAVARLMERGLIKKNSDNRLVPTQVL
jgi:archaellum biogenesis ATPase FlaH